MLTRLVHRPLLVVAAAAVVVLVPSCAKSSSPSDQTTPLPSVAAADFTDLTGRASVKIVVTDNAFTPQYARISAGTKVTFQNVGRNPHNVISVSSGQFTDVPTDKFAPGTSVVVALPDSGEVPYYCSLHGTPRAGMNGRIVIVPKG